MRVSKRSWHYRLISWSLGFGSHPKSLCPYFWTMNWCILTCLPRIIIRRMATSIEDISHKQNVNKSAIYREMSDMQAFKMLLKHYTTEELIYGGYGAVSDPVRIWWYAQEDRGRSPVKIISELAEAYEDGKIVFKGLSLKKAILQPVVSYMSYWFIGAWLISAALGYYVFSINIYWDLETDPGEMHTVLEAAIFGIVGIVLASIPYIFVFISSDDSNWWRRMKKKYYVPREDDIVGAMIKAWHRKACPVLEFSNK